MEERNPITRKEVNWVPLCLLDFNIDLEILISMMELIGIEAFARVNEAQVPAIIEIISKYLSVNERRLERLKKILEDAASSSGHGPGTHEDDDQESKGEDGMQQVDGEDKECEVIEDFEVFKENPNGKDEKGVVKTNNDQEHEKSCENSTANREEKKAEIVEGSEENPSGEVVENAENREENPQQEVNQEVDHGQVEDKEGEVIEDIEGLKENPNGEGEQKVIGTTNEEQESLANVENREGNLQQQVDGGNVEERRGQEAVEIYNPREQHWLAYAIDNAKRSKKLRNPKRVQR
ncbi:hypothetical protein L6452_13118 [Arctium lappa]|uniref:Uncharacterized protein n=1 Tax=Arctium lappa TaxID=4217 RepID=A0ACB9CHP7_ARCLA|nr:hypothetical protein L6452_13118 [Arctium lappa]